MDKHLEVSKISVIEAIDARNAVADQFSVLDERMLFTCSQEDLSTERITIVSRPDPTQYDPERRVLDLCVPAGSPELWVATRGAPRTVDLREYVATLALFIFTEEAKTRSLGPDLRPRLASIEAAVMRLCQAAVEVCRAEQTTFDATLAAQAAAKKAALAAKREELRGVRS